MQPNEKECKQNLKAVALLVSRDRARQSGALDEVQLLEVQRAEDLLRGQHGSRVVDALLQWRRNAGGVLT